jgi:hypothetical protein
MTRRWQKQPHPLVQLDTGVDCGMWMNLNPTLYRVPHPRCQSDGVTASPYLASRNVAFGWTLLASTEDEAGKVLDLFLRDTHFESQYDCPPFSAELLLLSASPCKRIYVFLKGQNIHLSVCWYLHSACTLSFITLDSLLTYLIYGARSLIPAVKARLLDPVLSHIYPAQIVTMCSKVQFSITCRQARIMLGKLLRAALGGPGNK